MGMVSFSDGAFVDHSPSTSFQTQLGYTNSAGNASGSIDSLNCNGGTGTASAVSLAYNELYKTNLPGALNLIMLETDGLPNTLVYNWWDGTNYGLANSSGCQDVNGRTKASLPTAGWQTSANARLWTSGHSMNTGGTGFMSDIPSGAIGSFYTFDPAQGTGFSLLYNPWQSTSNSSNNTTIGAMGTAPGCIFASGASSNDADFAWLPATDVYGNAVNPVNAYKSITTSGGHIPITGTTSTDWTNAHGGALNATENSAYRARTNATLPVYFYAIGLSGNGGNPPDPILLQRMANDPTPDSFNSPAAYQPCASETGCITYSTQPQGKFIWAPDSADLGKAFLAISSQILRLSH
jgi:hypothetical protein